MANTKQLDMYRTAARLGCGLPMGVRDFTRAAGVQVRLALTGQVGLGQVGVDLLYRFGGPVFIAREWDRMDTPDGWPYDAIGLDLATAWWCAPAEWWAYVCDLDRARLAAGEQGPVRVDPHWRPRPAIEAQTPLGVAVHPDDVLEGVVVSEHTTAVRQLLEGGQ